MTDRLDVVYHVLDDLSGLLDPDVTREVAVERLSQLRAKYAEPDEAPAPVAPDPQVEKTAAGALEFLLKAIDTETERDWISHDLKAAVALSRASLRAARAAAASRAKE